MSDERTERIGKAAVDATRSLLVMQRRLRDADILAAAVDRAIDMGLIGSRCLIADCRLDYGAPFSREEVERLLSPRLNR